MTVMEDVPISDPRRYHKWVLIGHQSRKLRRVTRSTYAAELFAALDSVSNGALVQAHLEELMGEKLPMQLMLDNKAAQRRDREQKRRDKERAKAKAKDAK